MSRLGKQITILLLFALAGCGGVSEADMTEVLGKAWAEDHRAMAEMAGVKLPGQEAGAMRGLSETVGTASNIASEYGGQFAADVAGEVIDSTTRLAKDYGVDGADEVRQSIGVATATDWSVRNLEILSGRESGNGYVALVRYDLTANVNGERVILGRDVSHKFRLSRGEDGWEFEKGS